VGAILDHQTADGSWNPAGVWGGEGGRVFSTATCVLALLAPASYPSHTLSSRAWRIRHAVGFDALAYARGLDDERIRAAAREYARLVEGK
jgi:hypothetical protein